MILKQYTAPKQGPPHPPTPVLLARDLFCKISGPEDGGCAFGWWVCCLFILNGILHTTPACNASCLTFSGTYITVNVSCLHLYPKYPR